MGSTNPSRLALGTAQFGLTYGIANRDGQVTAKEGARILDLARINGIDTLDTAMTYGDSEARLGLLGVDGIRVVTKLPPPPSDVDDIETYVRTSIEQSLRRLNVTNVYGLLLHRASDYIGHNSGQLRHSLERLKDQGLVTKVGVSIYGPSELESIADLSSIELVQAPFNVVDRRIIDSGWMSRLKDAGIEVHTRSAFLQGLLLMKPADMTKHFQQWAQIWNLWSASLKVCNVSAIEAAIGFVLAWPEIDRVVVGVDCAEQLCQILAASRRPTPQLPGALSSTDIDLIDPSTWRTN